MENNYDPFENVRTVMDEAAELGCIDKRLFEILKNPQREVKVYLCLLYTSDAADE